jgi:hypothetical protein
MAKIMAQQTSSQTATGRSEAWGLKRELDSKLVVMTLDADGQGMLHLGHHRSRAVGRQAPAAGFSGDRQGSV